MLLKNRNPHPKFVGSVRVADPVCGAGPVYIYVKRFD